MQTYLVTITCLGRQYVFCRLLPDGAAAATWAAARFRQACKVQAVALTPPAPLARTLH